MHNMGLNYPLETQFTIFVVLLTIWSLSTTTVLGSDLTIAKPGCNDTCGDIEVPFPFGTNESCYLSAAFQLNCTNSTLRLGNIPVLRISTEGQLWISKKISYICFKENGEKSADSANNGGFIGNGNMTFNASSNKFIVVGCDSYAYFSGVRNGRKYFSTGCISNCRSKGDITAGECSGAGCCETPIPSGIFNLETNLSSLGNYTYINGINNCMYASIVEKSFDFTLVKVTDPWKSDRVPAVLDWAIVDDQNSTCETVQSSEDYACKANTYCQNNNYSVGYRCLCQQGYQGNPYLDADGNGGCTDIDECKGSNLCKKNSDCQNTIGSYTCNCSQGYEGDGSLDGAAGCEDIDECEQGNHNCKEENTICNNTQGSYVCLCKTGFRGTPNLAGIGCADINECTEGTHNCNKKKNSYCLNTVGSFTCECKRGFKLEKGNCKRDGQVFYQLLAGISVSSVLILLACSWLYFIIKKRKSILRKEMMRDKFFKENGGLLLMEKFSKQQGDKTAKIYLENELEEATDNFAEGRILGEGGYGTVFKGHLKAMPNKEQQAIAVKKSKQMDKSQMDTFANEVFVLSQINHTNVVRLLGCCLDTESPLLVYEFINNGTLSEHIHDSTKASFLSLEIRLKIATETAEVLSYLHSAASPPIIHRDIKSANILLDNNYTAKVSDFGVSRLFPLDETLLPTVVLGTFGYLDPEYMLTGKLTVESDVYSYGVLLMEIMTGKKVVYFDKEGEERRLTRHFLSCLEENKLSEILDVNVLLQEGNYDFLIEVALVAKSCISIRGEDRPSMREVATKLRRIWEEMKKLHLQAEPAGTRRMEPLLLEPLLLEPSRVYGFDEISISVDVGCTSSLKHVDGR